MLFLPFLAILLTVFGIDEDENVDYVDKEKYFIKSESEYFIPQNESQIPPNFKDILKFDFDSTINYFPTTQLPSEPLLYRYNHEYHQNEIPFSICASSCSISTYSESSISICYFTEDTVKSSGTCKGYCSIDITFKNDKFIVKTNVPGSHPIEHESINDSERCYLFTINIYNGTAQIQTSDKQNLQIFQGCPFKTFEENEPSKFSQILLKSKIFDDKCLYKIGFKGIGNFIFQKPPESAPYVTTKISTTKKPTIIVSTQKMADDDSVSQKTASENIQFANIILYSICGGVGISIIVFIIACICSRRSKKEKFQKALTPRNPSIELDSTQTMPVKSSSQQLQVTQKLQPTIQISQPLHTAKLRKSVKSNRVSKISSDFQHLPSKSQSRQKVVTLSLNQNAKQRPPKKNPKGTTKNKTEKKDSYGTISATGHSKKVNQLKTASTLDRY